MVEIKEYIESGILEAYVLGSATEAEAKELLRLKVKYPEIGDALFKLEVDLESIAQQMAITPPPSVWQKIEDNMNELSKVPLPEPLRIHSKREHVKKESVKTGQFIEVEGQSSHMRIHKAWRWVFAAVFVLGKIFLGFAIYYFLENRQMKQEMTEMRQEIKLKH